MTTAIMTCTCTGVDKFEVKSGMAKSHQIPPVRPLATVPFHNRTKGVEYQEAKYGSGMRLHNVGGKGGTKTATCTVCNRRKII